MITRRNSLLVMGLNILTAVAMTAGFIGACFEIWRLTYLFIAIGMGSSILAWLIAEWRRRRAYRKLTGVHKQEEQR